MKKNNVIIDALNSLDLNLNSVSKILEIFNISIDDLINIIKEDTTSSNGLMLIYIGMGLGHFLVDYSTTVTDTVDSTIELPDFLANFKQTADFANGMREIGSFGAFPVQMNPSDIPVITDGLDDPIQNLFSLDFSILHTGLRVFGFSDHDSSIARAAVEQPTQQAAIDVINRLTASMDITGIFNFRLFVIDSPSFTYIARPFIPTDLLSLPTGNLTVHINNQITVNILDLPNNLDDLAQEIENLTQHVQGLENIWTSRNMDEEEDYLVNSSFREHGVALQALRYLEEILKLYVPFYSSWESRRDGDQEDQ